MSLRCLDRAPLHRHIERHPADTLRPGERVIRGCWVVYDLDELLDWLAVVAKVDAPDDLSGLSDDELTALLYQSIRLGWISKNRDMDLLRRCKAERVIRASDLKRACAAADGEMV